MRKALIPFLFLFSVSILEAQTTAFTYQGRLNNNGSAADGVYDLQFTVYDASTNGAVVSAAQTNSAVTVNTGLFTTQLDFGTNAFDGSARWLEIGVRTNGSVGAFTFLAPRQLLTATPYAIRAANASTAASVSGWIAASSLTGTISDALLSTNVALLNGSANFNGTLTGDGSGLTNVPGTVPWLTIAGTNQIVEANHAYLMTNPAQTSVMVPSSANVGDIITVSGGASGWQVLSSNVWTPRESVRAWTSIASSADGNKLVAGGDYDYIYTSTNAGATWIARDSVRNWVSVASSADGNKLMAVVNNGPIYMSSDAGVNWSPIGGGGIRSWTAVAGSTDGNKWIAVADGDLIFTYQFGGAASRETARSWSTVASSADGSKLVAAVLGGQIYTSTSAGTIWTPRETNRNWMSVASSANGNKLAAVAQSDQIYTSTDAGGTWTARENIRNWKAITSSADGNKLAAVVQGGQIYLSTDAGVTWTSQENNRSWNSIASSADGNNLAAVDSQPGRIYTCPGIAMSGQQGSVGTLQYVGNNVWQSLNPLDAGTISGGTISDASLSGNVALRNADQNFSGNNTFSGPVGIGGSNNVGAKLFVSSSTASSQNNTADFYAPAIGGNHSHIHFGTTGDWFIRSATNTGKVILQDSGGNVGIGTNAPAARLDVNGGINGAGPLYINSPGFPATTAIIRARSGDNLPLAVQTTGGANLLLMNTNGTSTFSGNVFGVAFNPTSDRNAKENFTPVDNREVLEKVSGLAISQWNFKGETNTAHVGPMAQDFYSAFGLGMDDRHIATVDADGIALAAIQALNQKVEEQKKENAALKQRLLELEQLVRGLSTKK